MLPYSKLTNFNLHIQGIARKVQQLTHKKYHEVASAVRLDAGKLMIRTVLSSVIMDIETSGRKDYTVVAIGTGTKCISYKHLNEDGLAVNDCHAEIVARRSFLRFLYAQLNLCAKGKEEESIFRRAVSGKYKLRSGTSFLLYISKAPCGAASAGINEHPNKIKHNTRAKIDGARGTVPVPETPKVWGDLKNRKESLLTMSCSDKIARWNVLGTQGSLLSVYTDPIYFKYIIIGSEFNKKHLEHAINQRVVGISDLPEPHKKQTNRLLILPAPESHVDKKRKRHPCSLNWSLGDEVAEVVECKTGQQHITKTQSRLCKKCLFRSFIGLWDQLASEDTKQAAFQQLPLDDAQVSAEQLQNTSYGKVKALAQAYQDAKQTFFKHFIQHSYGYWAKKPPEQDDFLS